MATVGHRPPSPAFAFTLPNGLKVVVVPKPGVPFVSMSLELMSGAWSETKPGTASMTLQMLTRGTGKHSEKELAEELETYAIDIERLGRLPIRRAWVQVV